MKAESTLLNLKKKNIYWKREASGMLIFKLCSASQQQSSACNFYPFAFPFLVVYLSFFVYFSQSFSISVLISFQAILLVVQLTNSSKRSGFRVV